MLDAMRPVGAAQDPLLDVRGLCLTLTGAAPAPVLDDVSFCVARGEVLALVGESGCGKTVACLTLLGLQQASMRITAGRVAYAGTDLVAAHERQLQAIRGRRIAMIFQDPGSALNPVHRVGETLVRLLIRHRNLTRPDATTEALRLLDRVGIPRPASRMSAYPHELSGGMNQRVMIAAALTGQPDVLIADEPTTALDVTTQAQILHLLAEVQRDTGMGMILISHDLAVVARIAHRVAVMYCGRVVETARSGDLFARPQHPYTAGLIHSMPPHPAALHAASMRAIPGMVAPISDLPTGCHFHPRCDRATGICMTTRPPRAMDAPGDFALCHHPLTRDRAA